MQLRIEHSSVYTKNLKAIEDGYKIIVNEGSSRSTKTFSIMQILMVLGYESKKKLTYTIVREKMTWLKSTLLKDFEEILNMYNIPVKPEINRNRPDQVYEVFGCEFAFFGLDYPEKFKGRKQDVFWINEAMESNIKVFDQLEMRTSLFGMLDYNPSDDEHWIFDRVLKRDDAIMIHSTFNDNPFLEESIVKKIKSYNPNNPDNVRQGTSDKYMWEVYGLGKRARLKGLVFERFEIVDAVPASAEFLGHGLDFGYSNSPSAFGSMYVDGKDLYLEEGFYETGLTNQDIIEKLKEMSLSKYEEIIGDSAEPKSIEEIFREGYNIKPAMKGTDSIMFGINILKQYNIKITKESINAISEFKKYKWREDKNGKSLNMPIDEYNHFIDQARYVAMIKLGKDGLEEFRSQQTDGLITANLMEQVF